MFMPGDSPQEDDAQGRTLRVSLLVPTTARHAAKRQAYPGREAKIRDWRQYCKDEDLRFSRVYD